MAKNKHIKIGIFYLILVVFLLLFSFSSLYTTSNPGELFTITPLFAVNARDSLYIGLHSILGLSITLIPLGLYFCSAQLLLIKEDLRPPIIFTAIANLILGIYVVWIIIMALDMRSGLASVDVGFIFVLGMWVAFLGMGVGLLKLRKRS